MEQQNSRNIVFCQKCIMPNSRPRIVFDKSGICNACRNAEEKKKIDWNLRKIEFFDIIQHYKSKKGNWDCLVPWSGGKDSSSIAYKLKFEFGMNPLLVTFSPVIPNEIGNINRENLINIGFDHIYFRPNQKVHRFLSRRFFIERGNPKVAWDAGVNAIPVQIALQHKIPLIFYAEHGESEYGGKVIDNESKKKRNFTEVIEHQIGDDPRNWVDENIQLKDLNPYIYPESSAIENADVKAYYFSYFFKWSMLDNYNYIKTKYNFKTHPEGRTVGTFTNFDSLDDKLDNLYYYMQYIKFGFGRAIRDACRMIQNDQMTREEAIEIAQKYDGEFPKEYLGEALDYLSLDEKQFTEIVDNHRNPEIWLRENGQWKLRFPILT